jgi:hypothetical protein
MIGLIIGIIIWLVYKEVVELKEKSKEKEKGEGQNGA